MFRWNPGTEIQHQELQRLTVGMLNAVGLQNPGVETFMAEEIPYLKTFQPKIIANVVGKTTDEYCQVVERLSDSDVDVLENQYLLSEYQRGRDQLWSRSQNGSGGNKVDQKENEQAVLYEDDPKCDRHHGDCKSGGI